MQLQPESKRFRATVQGRPSSIAVVDGDIGTALKIFKKQTKSFGTQLECFERRWFKSKSKTRRLQLEAARYVESKNADRQKAS